MDRWADKNCQVIAVTLRLCFAARVNNNYYVLFLVNMKDTVCYVQYHVLCSSTGVSKAYYVTIAMQYEEVYLLVSLTHSEEILQLVLKVAHHCQ